MKTLELYQNKEWLEKKYIEEELTMRQIGTLCEMNYNAIRNDLLKLNIPIRSRSEAIHIAKANSCDISKKAIEWINGELLGDGCLYSHTRYSADFRYTSKYLEYINYISKTLKSFGIKQSGKIRKYYYKKYNCYTYHYCSLSYIELLPIYRQWYPNDKKSVPKNIKLTPITNRQWMIGDGSLRIRKEGKPYIRLSTYGYSQLDVKFLKNQLINLGFKTTRELVDNVINISTKSTKDFLNYIGKCPVECYQYKFNYGVVK